jgi:hypothetical protein
MFAPFACICIHLLHLNRMQGQADETQPTGFFRHAQSNFSSKETFSVLDLRRNTFDTHKQ